ncbi:Sulfurtransferase [Paraconexibacter sp. AEG42_29]|uniref:Sulfurtransferase n=1 Tax=Paraconexibacter sp. AEG42_29 TaxID=2997339 RepID=A0AAU7AZP0_9ACTN
MTSVFPPSDGLEVSPEQTQQALADGTAIVVDVREQDERDAGYIEGSRHIPLQSLSSEAATLPKDTTIVFQCRVGGRSGMAAQALRASGYADAWSMAGGLLQWDAEGRPLAPDGGVVADH